MINLIDCRARSRFDQTFKGPLRTSPASSTFLLPSLDINTNDGRLIADILASLAAHERRRTRDRQQQGIAVAKAAGRHLGQPPKMSGQQIAEACSRLADDEPVRVVARAYGVSDKTLRATLARRRS